jgi:hypothetical protein
VLEVLWVTARVMCMLGVYNSWLVEKRVSWQLLDGLHVQHCWHGETSGSYHPMYVLEPGSSVAMLY